MEIEKYRGKERPDILSNFVRKHLKLFNRIINPISCTLFVEINSTVEIYDSYSIF